jgi:hypothetical protein
MELKNRSDFWVDGYKAFNESIIREDNPYTNPKTYEDGVPHFLDKNWSIYIKENHWFEGWDTAYHEKLFETF